MTHASWDAHTLCAVSGRTVVALRNDGPGDLWATARCASLNVHLPCCACGQQSTLARANTCWKHAAHGSYA